MALNNNINAPTPFSAALGGTGVTSPTIHGVLVAQGASPVTPIVLTAGQVLVGTTASDPAGATITGSGGITVNATSGAIDIAGTGTGLTVVNQTTGSVTMTANRMYLSNAGASLITYTTPATAALGDIFVIVGKGSGLWTIAVATGQSIVLGNVTSTVTTGTVTSQNAGDCIWLVCTTADLVFTRLFQSGGNLVYT